MRSRCLFLIALCLSAAPPSNGHPIPQTLSIDLSLPMKSVTVHDGLVSYTWFTAKPGRMSMRQDLSDYDRHTAQKALTPSGRAWLSSWAGYYHVFTFEPRYPPTQPGSYGAAFVTRLTVMVGKQTMSSRWDGTSQAKTPNRAAEALVTWARQASGSGE